VRALRNRIKDALATSARPLARRSRGSCTAAKYNNASSPEQRLPTCSCLLTSHDAPRSHNAHSSHRVGRPIMMKPSGGRLRVWLWLSTFAAVTASLLAYLDASARDVGVKPWNASLNSFDATNE
jgi:hypothetical protein